MKTDEKLCLFWPVFLLSVCRTMALANRTMPRLGSNCANSTITSNKIRLFDYCRFRSGHQAGPFTWNTSSSLMYVRVCTRAADVRNSTWRNFDVDVVAAWKCIIIKRMDIILINKHLLMATTTTASCRMRDTRITVNLYYMRISNNSLWAMTMYVYVYEPKTESIFRPI